MARKANSISNKLCSKIYFIQNEYSLYGPYSKRPTSQLKSLGGDLIIFELNEQENYIKK